MIATPENQMKIYSITSANVRKILPELIKLKIPLRRRRKDGSFRFVPLNEFDQFLKDKQMTFYLDLNSIKKLKQGVLKLKNRYKKDQSSPEKPAQSCGHVKWEGAVLLDNVFRNEMDQIKNTSIENRAVEITENNHFIKLLIEGKEGKKNVGPEVVTKVGELFAKALCINKVTLEENLNEYVKDDHINTIILETYKMISNLLENIKRCNTVWRDIGLVQYIKSGSESLDHMVRLLMLYIPYLYFYNLYFVTHSNEIKKFRAYFNDTFYKYYNKIIKDKQKLNLEIVFKNGIAPVQNRSTFIQYCMGCFFHDLGKFPEINYNEMSEEYNQGQGRRHVFDGFNILFGSGKFRWNILSTMLLHHDYYGAPFGYRQLDTFKSKFIERRKQRREESNEKYLISYNIMDVGYGNSYSYFPNKLLEIVDLYDSLTKPDGDKYAVMDALAIMKAKYIEGDHLGIDPILFNIFVDFLHASKIIINPLEVKQLKISKPD